MRRKSARRHKSRRKTKRQSSFYFWLALLIIILVLAGKTVYKNLQDANVLGKSIFLAQEFQAPPPGNPPPAQDQPQQQSQPQQQPQQQSQPAQQQPQQQQTSQQTGQQPAYQPQQNYSQQPQQQYQPKNQEEQKQYQQYQQQGEQQRSQQNQQYQQTGQPGQQSQSGQPGQPGQPNNQPGIAGQTPPTQEQYQQYQQQFQKEAAKFGIQFSGNLPQQYQQYQIQQNSNTQKPSSNTPGQGNQIGQGNINTFQPLPSLKDFPTITGKFEVQSANRGQNINLNDGNTRIVLGNNVLKARSADGKEVELHNDELEKINQAIELSTGSKIEQMGKNFVMKRGGVEAQTNFPISFNIATKTFTITTPSGEKELNFMPDQALQKLMENKIISRIETPIQGSGAGTDTGFKLTEFENQPVFEVKGVSQEKFLGFVPVSIPKTTFVSAESGDLVKTDVSIFNRLLDTISF